MSQDQITSQAGVQVDRREFISAGAAAAAGLALVGPAEIVVPAARARMRRADGAAHNLIFMVSDGMSMGTLQLADRMRLLKDGRHSVWIEMLRTMPVRRALMETSAADSIVTDSAAASTQWGTGEPADNSRIGMTPDGRFPTPILVHAKQAGKATGLITTTRLTHATPAGFIANIPSQRDDEQPIADQILERRVDVMLGGGAKFLHRDLIAGKNDLDVVRTAADLEKWAALSDDVAPLSHRILGLFAEQHMMFSLDRPEQQPTLAQMTRTALARLAKYPNGFVVQIEGGRVDHAAHSNDAGSLVSDQLAFDDAIAAALEFVQRRDDTLLIVTTDHGNANPGLTDYGARGNAGFEKLAGVKRSFEWIERELIKRGAEARQGEGLRALIAEATGVALEADELAMLQRMFASEPVDPFILASKGFGPLGSVLANHFAVAFLSPNHTSDFVEFTALGPGSELVPQWLTMRDVHGVMVKALGLPAAKPV